MSLFDHHEERKILKHEEEVRKKNISNLLKQAGNFFTNHFSVLSARFNMAGSYEEKLDLSFPNSLSSDQIDSIKHEILEQGKFMISYFSDKNTFRITISEESLPMFKAKKFNFNQPKFQLDKIIPNEKAEEIKTATSLDVVVQNPLPQVEEPILNQNTNKKQQQTKNNNDMAKKDLNSLREDIKKIFVAQSITTKNYISFISSADGKMWSINCRTPEDALSIYNLLIASGLSVNDLPEGSKTVRVSIETLAPFRKSKRRLPRKKSNSQELTLHDQLRIIADQLENQKTSDPDSIFAKLVGDAGELMVRTKDKKGNEVLKNISKEKFLACFK